MSKTPRGIDFRIDTLTAERVQHWLTKTARSISSNGGADVENNYRLGMLIDRYNQMRERAQELGVWQSHCEKHGWSPEHNGFDCAA